MSTLGSMHAIHSSRGLPAKDEYSKHRRPLEEPYARDPCQHHGIAMGPWSNPQLDFTIYSLAAPGHCGERRTGKTMCLHIVQHTSCQSGAEITHGDRVARNAPATSSHCLHQSQPCDVSLFAPASKGQMRDNHRPPCRSACWTGHERRSNDEIHFSGCHVTV